MIELILKNDKLRKEIGKSGRRLVQSFEKKKIIKEYALAYHRIISEFEKKESLLSKSQKL